MTNWLWLWLYGELAMVISYDSAMISLMDGEHHGLMLFIT